MRYSDIYLYGYINSFRNDCYLLKLMGICIIIADKQALWFRVHYMFTRTLTVLGQKNSSTWAEKLQYLAQVLI